MPTGEPCQAATWLGRDAHRCLSLCRRYHRQPTAQRSRLRQFSPPGHKPGRRWRLRITGSTVKSCGRDSPGNATGIRYRYAVIVLSFSVRPEVGVLLVQGGNAWSTDIRATGIAGSGSGIATFRNLRDGVKRHIYRLFRQFADISVTHHRRTSALSAAASTSRLKAVESFTLRLKVDTSER